VSIWLPVLVEILLRKKKRKKTISIFFRSNRWLIDKTTNEEAENVVVQNI
jgi:hypothetical protein